MKEFFSNLLLLIVLSFAISAYTGCGSSANLERGSKTESNAATAADTGKKPSVYPKLASAIAQSDIKNLDGTTFKIADKKGKVLLLNMWATWCGPCRSEMPALVKMQEQYRDQGLEVIGLNADSEELDAINKFAASMNLNYPLVWPDTALQKEFLKISQFDGIPQSFLVDRDGNLTGVFTGANPKDVQKMAEIVGKLVRGEDLGPEPAKAEAVPAASSAASLRSDAGGKDFEDK
ncbi:MAG: TlpA disulfide reductase family protein [Pyrinomonadaceae bacterium]